MTTEIPVTNTRKRWGSTPHHLNCFIDFLHHRVIFQCWQASILFLGYQYVTWLKSIWAPISKLLPLHTIFGISANKIYSVKRCFSERMFLSFSSRSRAVTWTPSTCYRLDQFISTPHSAPLVDELPSVSLPQQ